MARCARRQRSKASLASSPHSASTAQLTAGTSSLLTDGALATLITSEAYARTSGLEVLGRIRSVAIAGVPAEIMGMGPCPLRRKRSPAQA